jgi:hypothetical protein
MQDCADRVLAEPDMAADQSVAQTGLGQFDDLGRLAIGWTLSWLAAEPLTASLGGGESGLRALRDHGARLLGQRGEQMQHERIGVRAQLGDDEWHSVRHQAADETLPHDWIAARDAFLRPCAGSEVSFRANWQTSGRGRHFRHCLVLRDENFVGLHQFRDLAVELFDFSFQLGYLSGDRLSQIRSGFVQETGPAAAELVELIVRALVQVVQGFELVNDLGIQCFEKFP